MIHREDSDADDRPPIHHVLVVGFHHKKGCQVEYVHPSFEGGELPRPWRHLPSLALPDGSHNYLDDFIYFHLPGLDDPAKTVFGVSCFRQVDVSELKVRTEDMTRGTVQKSVCVLGSLPLYGQIKVKLSLVAHAYFREGDFANTNLVEQTYKNLLSCLDSRMLRESQLHVGLSACDLVAKFGHRLLVMFKLLLLERRVLFYGSPVGEISDTIVTLMSLFPGLLESGLGNVSPLASSSPAKKGVATPEAGCTDTSRTVVIKRKQSLDAQGNFCDKENDMIIPEKVAEIHKSCKDRAKGHRHSVASSESPGEARESWSEDEEYERAVEDGATEAIVLPPDQSSVDSMSVEELGLPLILFSESNPCLPYISLPYLDALASAENRGYIAGVSNILFRQKRDLSDAVVDVSTRLVEFRNPRTAEALAPTREDLRFVENLTRTVRGPSDGFSEAVGWEGGEEWVRAQFKYYLVCLLRTSLASGGGAAFNARFVSEWRKTFNHSLWLKARPDSFLELAPGHPFSGQLSVADVRLQIGQVMKDTEGGRKVSDAAYVASKALGNSISSAKGALSSMWKLYKQPQNSPSH